MRNLRKILIKVSSFSYTLLLITITLVILATTPSVTRCLFVSRRQLLAFLKVMGSLSVRSIKSQKAAKKWFLFLLSSGLNRQTGGTLLSSPLRQAGLTLKLHDDVRPVSLSPFGT